VRATGGVHEDVAGWLELGGRFVAEQDRVDERFPEDRTPGHAVFHLRAGLGVGENVRLELGVENLLDREYHDHLTPPVVVGAGDLEPGDDVPAPGRTFLLRVEVDF